MNSYRSVPNMNAPLYEVATRFWRPAISFVGLIVIVILAVRIAMGLPMPDVAAVLAVLAPLMFNQISRTLEVRQEQTLNADAARRNAVIPNPADPSLAAGPAAGR